MYLKRIELIGFKSFYEKTRLEFDSGIAVVVGPNGCGKSNLVDAIRWALGEQSSKSLRGDRMEEIIFSGTQQRKPLNLAEASLTFGDVGSSLEMDYEEVTITRRLYRSGESEYLLNKAPCRLKDITGLFLDTGMGKDFYSVIGQGRIEEIINSRPEERREIFEEAAGILKYKLRKREAQRRLDETRENMVRVHDLISELGLQVKPLEDQASLAKEYRFVLEQLNESKRGLLTYRIWFFKDQWKKVGLKLEQVVATLSSMVAEGGQREEQLFGLKQRLQDQAGALKMAENELNQRVRELEQLEGKQQLLLERSNRHREQLQEIAGLYRSCLDETSSLAGRQKQLEEDLEEKRLATVEVEERRDQLEQDLKLLEEGSLFKGLEQQQQELLGVTSRYNAFEAAVQELTPLLEREAKREEIFRRDEREIRGELAANLSQQEELRARVELCRRQVGDLEKSHQGESTKIQVIEKQLETTLGKQQKEREELRSLDSRLQLLQEQEADLSGYFRGVKALIQASQAPKPVLKGIIGPVVDLVTVGEEYLRAVEMSLGSGLQYIVTETAEAAKKAIGFLKERNSGWATFLPLDTITPYPSRLDRYPQWRNGEGVLGKLAEYVNTESRYRLVVDYLLGNVVVCRDLETAFQAARTIKYSCQVISLQGEVINPGGSVRGGSFPKGGSGLLGRRHETGSLQKERDRLGQEQLKTSSQIKDYREEISSLNEALEKTARQLGERQRELTQLLKLDETLNQNRRYLEEKLDALGIAREEYRKEMAALADRLQAAGEQARDYEIKLAGVRKAVEEKKELYEQGKARKVGLEKELTECLIGLNSHREKIGFLEEKLAQISAEGQRIKRLMEGHKEREEAVSRALAGDQAEQEVLQSQFEQKNRSLVLVTDQVKQEQDELRATELKMADLEGGDKNWRDQLQRLERRKQQLELKYAQLEAELKLWGLRYNELFGEEEPGLPDQDFNPEQAEKKAEMLQEQLAALGEVNLGAIEELSRLEERIAFLHRQLEDLEGGELSLHKVLAEIDQHMAGHFTSTLELINRNFLSVFEDLFGGGKAYLELTDPGQLLESGVEIIAQPPGKKLQKITLLSTGEKVLTALALVFAILLHKPAPFYVLDEVESALDETNLGKFSSYLQKLSGQAQFILITHRKQTMDTAGTIYGVTMPEPGISKLISVKR